MNKQREEMAWMWPGETKHSLRVPSAQVLLHFYCFAHKSVNSHTWHSENCNITCWCNELPHNIRSFLSLNFALSVLHQQPQDFHFSIYSNIFSQHPILTRCYSNTTCRLVSLLAVCHLLKLRLQPIQIYQLASGPLKLKLQEGTETVKTGTKERSKTTAKPYRSQI